MVIQTEKAVYEVIQRLEESQEHRSYLCRGGVDTEWRYLVNAYLGEQLPREQIMYFIGLSIRGELLDFEECFFQSGYLYVIFRESTAPALKSVLQTQRVGLTQRLAIGKSLMEQILQKQLSDYLLYEALRLDNVHVDSNSEVSFCYHLRERERINDILFPAICERLALLHEMLLDKELASPAALPFQKLIEKLKNGDYESYPELYQAYRRAYEAVLPLVQNDTLVIESKREKLLRYAKAGWQRLRKWIVWLVIVLLLIWLVHSVRNPSYTGEPLNFNAIGEVSLSPKDTEEDVQSDESSEGEHALEE